MIKKYLTIRGINFNFTRLPRQRIKVPLFRKMCPQNLPFVLPFHFKDYFRILVTNTRITFLSPNRNNVQGVKLFCFVFHSISRFPHFRKARLILNARKGRLGKLIII